jgi:hypothetical protein
MAKKNIPNLSEGFEEVPLSEGFEEVPLSQPFPAEKSTLESIGETASDVGRGVLSGLTLGGLEELTAGAKALASEEKDDFSTLYKKYLEVEEQKEKAAKERSPTASLVGEIGGSLLPAFATGGIGLAASGGRAAAQLGGKELLKAAGKAALAEGALGTVGGAVAGGLSSEGGLIGATEEEKEKLLEDVKSGALTGGVFGAALGAGGPLVKAGAEKFKEGGRKLLGSTLLGEEVLVAKEMGEQGKGFTTKASRKARDVEKTTNINEIKDDLLKIENSAAEEFKAPLKRAAELDTKISVPFDVDPEKGIAEANLFLNEGEKKIADRLEAIATDGLDPYSAYELRREIKQAAERNPKLLSVAQDLVPQIDDAIEDSLQDPKVLEVLQAEGLPTSFKEGLDTYSKVLTSTIESITEEGKPIDARRRFFRDLPASEATLFEKTTGLVDRLSLPGTTSEKAIRSIHSEEGGLIPLLNKLAKEKPEELERVAKRLGFENPEAMRDSLVKKIEKTSKESAVKRVIQGEREIASGVPTLGGLSDLLTRKPLVASANILGQAEAAVKKGVAEVSKKQPIAAIKSIYKLPETALRKMATSMESRPAFKQYATQLGQAIDAGDSVKKEAILFALMQRPDFRQMVPSITGMGDEENEQ